MIHHLHPSEHNPIRPGFKVSIYKPQKTAKVQVDFDPSVVSRYRLLGYENRRIADRDFRNGTVDAGEVGAGHAVTALYEIKLSDDVQGRIAANTANETTLPDRR